jgi:hypothetical protein
MTDRDVWDEERELEAQQEAAAEAEYDRLRQTLGPEWARDHADELFKEHYDGAVNHFTSERMQSYYLRYPNLAGPARDSLTYAKSLRPVFPRAALVFAVTSTELLVKTVFLKPIIFGLIHTEDLAIFITELTTLHTGVDRFRTLLTKILSEFGSVDLATYKRGSSNQTLWQEICVVQEARNGIIHRGIPANDDCPDLAVAIAETLLNDIFPHILKSLNLRLDHSTNAIVPLKTTSS